MIGRTVATGLLAAAASAAVLAVFSRRDNAHAARAMNAVAHIYDGGPPSGQDGRGHRNTKIGLALHAGASIWWAAFFEFFCGRAARRSVAAAAAGGAAIATAAYVVDYYVVGPRFQPGFERYLSRGGLFAVYASLAAAFALSARLHGLRDHQVKDRDEREERRHAERGPEGVVAPELRRQWLA